MQTLLDNWYKGRTLVFGHRGASAYAPMNTIPAFELAAAQGADGIELDVHRSADGHAVICHDFTVDSTTDGSGTVIEMTLAELKELDAGSWFGNEFKGVRIPTLDEVFAAVGRKVYINIEIKSQNPTNYLTSELVAKIITQHGMQNRVIVSSFYPLVLDSFCEIMPRVPIGFLHGPGDDEEAIMLMEQLGLAHEAWHPHHSLIDKKYMTWAKSKDFAVNTWTVNDPLRAIELRDLGVNAIITDKPDVILAALRGT